MAITQEQQKALNQANFAEGGINFISDKSKIDILDQPILVVGLGGSGIDALLRVKSKVNEVYKTKVDPTTGKKKLVPDNIKFIGVDTDKSYFINPETGKAGHSYKGMVVSEEEALNIGASDLATFLGHARANHDTYITDWVSEGVQLIDASDGANGVRQIGRLCLFKNYDKIFDKFNKVIKQLVEASGAADKKLMVFVLGGISGGTGSGTFIDIPYIIHSAAKSAMGMPESADLWQKITILGYFLTPDINLLNHRADRIEENGYAALKELDYLMGIDQRGETFTQKYTTASSVRSNERPYGLVNFVSSTFKNGTPVADAYQVALQVIAENIIYFTSSSSCTAGDTLGAWSYQNNVNTEINDMVSFLSTTGKVRPVGYRYGIIGSSGKILPVQDIMTCLASMLLDDVNAMWEEHGEPTTQEVNKIVGPTGFKFDEASLMNKLMAGIATKFEDIKESQSYPQSNYNSVKGGGNANNDFERMMQTTFARITANYTSPNFKASIEENFENQLKLYFTNTAPILFPNPTNRDEKPTYGPKFANDVLVGVAGGTSLNAADYCYQQLNRLVSESNQLVDMMPGLVNDANTKCSETQKSLLSGRKHYDEYMTAMQTLYNAKLRKQVIDNVLIPTYNYLREIIINANHTIYGTIYSTLTSLRAIFDKNMEVMGNVEQRKTIEGVVMSWNVVQMDSVNETIKEALSAAEIRVSVGKLYDTIWNKKEQWCSSDMKTYNVFEEITDFLATEFHEILGFGLETFLKKEMEKDKTRTYTSFNEYLKLKVDPELVAKSEIMFNTRAGFEFDAAGKIPGRLYVQIPKTCTVIQSEIKNAHAGEANFEVAPSDNEARIIYNKGLYGFPLYTYGIIEQLEKKYEDKMYAGGAGLHLYQNGDKNWRDLPALCPPDTYSTGYHNQREVDRIKHAEEVFDKARAYNIIRMSTSGTVYVAHFAGDLELEALKKQAGTNIIGMTNLSRQLQEYIDGKKDLPGDIEKFRNAEGCLEVILKGNDIEANAKFWFTASYELIKKVEAEIAKFDRIKETLEGLKADISAFDKYYIYAQALLTETIVRQGAKYVYVPSNATLEPVMIASQADLNYKKTPEFEIFNLVFEANKMHESHKKQLLADVNAKFEDFKNADYDEVYCPTIDKLVANLSAIKDYVDFNSHEVLNAQDVLDFYNVIISYLDGLR